LDLKTLKYGMIKEGIYGAIHEKYIESYF